MSHTFDAVGGDDIPLSISHPFLRGGQGRELEGVVLVADRVVLIHVQRFAQPRVRKGAVIACVLHNRESKGILSSAHSTQHLQALHQL